MLLLLVLLFGGGAPLFGLLFLLVMEYVVVVELFVETLLVTQQLDTLSLLLMHPFGVSGDPGMVQEGMGSHSLTRLFGETLQQEVFGLGRYLQGEGRVVILDHFDHGGVGHQVGVGWFASQ